MEKIRAAIRKYIRPREWTFWLGILLVTSGILRANAIELPFGVSAIARPIMDAYVGGSSGALILAGIGFISVNGKAARD